MCVKAHGMGSFPYFTAIVLDTEADSSLSAVVGPISPGKQKSIFSYPPIQQEVEREFFCV